MYPGAPEGGFGLRFCLGEVGGAPDRGAPNRGAPRACCYLRKAGNGQREKRQRQRQGVKKPQIENKRERHPKAQLVVSAHSLKDSNRAALRSVQQQGETKKRQKKEETRTGS